MQDELEADYPNLDIQILSINMLNASGAQSLSASQNLPMVQDNSNDLIWSNWGATWRDVIIIDGNNEIYATYNLTSNSIGNSTNYDTLKQLFIDAAGTL